MRVDEVCGSSVRSEHGISARHGVKMFQGLALLVSIDDKAVGMPAFH
jgi:hypothetical protein